MLATVPVVPLNVAVVNPSATVTEPGTVRTVFVLLRITNAPPVGAALLSDIVQPVDPFGPTLVGLQASEDTITGATRLTVVFAALLLYVAVTVAL